MASVGDTQLLCFIQLASSLAVYG